MYKNFLSVFIIEFIETTYIETKPKKYFYKNVAPKNRKGCGHDWEEILCLNKMQLIKNTSQFQLFYLIVQAENKAFSQHYSPVSPVS